MGRGLLIPLPTITNVRYMKKTILFTIFSVLAVFCSVAQELESREDLPVKTDFGAVMINPDGSDFSSFPATMTLGTIDGDETGSQWCDVALWLTPFSIADYPVFRVKLQRGYPTDGVVQLFARNHYSSVNYGGPYIPFKANQTELEGEFAEFDTNGYFDDDPVCVWFAMQYTQKGKEQLRVESVTLIDEDGEEFTSRNIRNDSWRPSPDWIEPDSVYAADVRFDQRGTIGCYKSNVPRRKAHYFIYKFADPLPAGFKFNVMLTIDYDFDVYTYEVPAGVTEWKSPAITEDYRCAYMEYKGTYPTTMHVDGIVREVYNTTGVEKLYSDDEVACRRFYSIEGRELKSLEKGVNILREFMTDGYVRTTKVIKP